MAAVDSISWPRTPAVDTVERIQRRQHIQPRRRLFISLKTACAAARFFRRPRHRPAAAGSWPKLPGAPPCTCKPAPRICASGWPPRVTLQYQFTIERRTIWTDLQSVFAPKMVGRVQDPFRSFPDVSSDQQGNRGPCKSHDSVRTAPTLWPVFGITPRRSIDNTLLRTHFGPAPRCPPCTRPAESVTTW